MDTFHSVGTRSAQDCDLQPPVVDHGIRVFCLHGFIAMSQGNDFTDAQVQDQLSTCTNIYVEEVLSEHFSGLLTFVKRAEAANKARGDRPDAPPATGFGAAEAGPVVRDFSTRWASAIEQQHRCTLRFYGTEACTWLGLWQYSQISA